MSARLLVLPQLWATGTTPRQPLAWAAGTIAARAEETPFVPGRRRGPHSLRLVRAAAVPAVPAPAPAKPPRALPVRVSPRMAFYRVYTEAMLRRYGTLRMESGRVPSLIGKDLFRGNVTHCRVSGFDDAVNFVHDMDRCLAALEPAQRWLIRRIAVEGYAQGEAAAMAGIPLRTVIRRYAEAVDRLTRLLLERGLMEEQLEATEA